MNLFIKKIIIYLGLFFVVAVLFTSLIYYLFDDALLGYSNYQEKYRMNELISRGNEYDVVVFGSSYSDLHINTPYFDELSGGTTNSFNVGQWGVTPSNVVKVMEEMLPYIPNTNVVIVDMFSEVRDMDSVKIDKFRYLLTFKGWILFVENTLHGHKLMQKESVAVNVYEITKIYISKILGVGLIKHIKNDYQSKHIDFSDNKLSEKIHNEKGYVYEFTDDKPGREKMLGLLKNDFPELEKIRETKIRNSKKALVDNLDSTYNPNYEYERYSKVANMYRDAGKQVIFFINPLGGFPSDAVSIGKKLEEDGFVVIPFIDSEKYPELFEIKNWYDVGHLNYEGSKIFTEYLYKNVSKFFNVK